MGSAPYRYGSDTEGIRNKYGRKGKEKRLLVGRFPYGYEVKSQPGLLNFLREKLLNWCFLPSSVLLSLLQTELIGE
jgi:hypothetical protein